MSIRKCIRQYMLHVKEDIALFNFMQSTFCEAARTFKAALRRAVTLVAGHEGRWPSLSDLAQPDLSMPSAQHPLHVLSLLAILRA